MSWSDDPIRDYSRYETEQYLKSLTRPICFDCQEPIMDDDCWVFFGHCFCENCVRDHKENVERYIGN